MGKVTVKEQAENQQPQNITAGLVNWWNTIVILENAAHQ